MFHYLLLKYLLCGTLIKRCTSGGEMHFYHLLLFPNGVKQRGIMSPFLVNVYMDGLNVLLNSPNIWG